MSTLNQAMLLDGQALSNNDPNMVITLKGADAAKVEITAIGNDSITYSFKEGVPTDTLYDLSLSFVYKELYSLDVPLSLVNLGTVKDWEIVDTPIAATCWERSEALPFKVMKGEEDITSQLVDVSFVPKSILKAGDTGAKSWTIESESAFSATTLKVMYSFRLPDDLPEVTRTYEGTFNIAEYDGQELKVTLVNDPIRITVGTPTVVKFDIKCRNYRDATPYVRYLQALSVTTPINYSSQTLSVADQQLHVTFAAPSSATVDGVLIFGTAGTNSVEGKNRITLNLPMKAYVPGLAMISRDPTSINGKENAIVKVKYAIEFDGEPVPNDLLDITIDNLALFTVESKEADGINYKIVVPNNTSANTSYSTTVTLKYGGGTISYVQGLVVLPSKVVTVTPSSTSYTLPKGSLFSSDIVISDGDGTEFAVTDPRVTITVQSGSSTYAQFVEKYDGGFISKLTYSGGSNIAIIQYDVKVTGVPGTGLITSIVTIAAGSAVTDCKYTQAGSLSPNQETVAMNNKYQIGDVDVTVDKVLLTKYVNNPSTGNAIIELLDKPTTANNIGFGRNAKTGWSGALAEMTEYIRLPGGNVVYKATGNQQVAQAPITANVLNNTFNFVDGVKTDVFVTLVQERLGQEDWNFATSTDIRNIMVNGTVKSATVVNENGTFRVTVTGNGTEGEGSVTFSVVEGDVHYPKKIDLVAIEGLSVTVQPQYKTVYGKSDSDIMVRAVAQMGGVNLGGDVIEVVSDNPTITVKSVTTQGGYCDVILTSSAGTELENQTVKLTYTIKEGKPNAGLTADDTASVYITSRKFMVYNGSGIVEGRRFSINPMLRNRNGTPQKLVFLKDGIEMDPTDPDIDYSLSTRDVAELPEIVGVDDEGKLFIKIRQDTDGFKGFYIKYRLISDPSYTYGELDQADVRLDINKTAGANMNSNINFGERQFMGGSTEGVINDKFLNGLDNSPMTGKLIWQRNYNNPVTGNPFFNKDTAKAVQVGTTADFSFDLKTGWTGDYATIKMLHLSDIDGLYRNGSISVKVNKTPIVVTNNDNTLLGPNLVTPVTLQIHQNRWGDPSENLANTQILNPTVANNLFTVADIVNNNDGTISFNATAKAAGTALFSFTIKDGEFEYPASIQLTVGMYPLELGDGFIKDIEGNSKQTVTVVQNVKLPE
ncbi:hypothetical protein D5W64_12615 [Salmonella enterica subsp. enterica serovar Saintpaul]|nr:hypothetical protein [Salmonella enterica subsp. enterica serovar Saintpaul]